MKEEAEIQLYSPDEILSEPFCYKIFNNRGRWVDYSGRFTSKEIAVEWYEKEGNRLEKLFNRRLVLFEYTNQITN